MMGIISGSRSLGWQKGLENGKDTAELGKAIYLANILGLDIAVNARGKQ